MNHLNQPFLFPFAKDLPPVMADKVVLGGKGAALVGMTALGLPVPPGITISTEACTKYRSLPKHEGIKFCRELATKVITHYENHIVPSMGFMPLVSVRSGARVSMPGMMDTVLNVGVTTGNVGDWMKRIGTVPALDCYRRLIEMLSGVVYDFPADDLKEGLSKPSKPETEEQRLTRTIIEYKATFAEVMEMPFPDTLLDQLAAAIEAVFRSWDNERAIEYRAMYGYSDSWGTAVTVQSMVFGNFNDKSCSGVMFTRCPKTGNVELFGEFLPNAQGEDVVAGTHTPLSLDDMEAWNPDLRNELVALAEKLEAHYGDMQDIEFTVQDGKLYVLQTRNGKRSAQAAFRIAYDMVQEKKITRKEAVSRVSGKQFYTMKAPSIDPKFKTQPNFQGIPAAGALVTGTAVMSAAEAKKFKGDCILVAVETTPDDFGGMVASVGILTSTGGATSHAAVVARGMDKTCVVGCTSLKPGVNVKAGDTITLDGATGRVWVGVKVPIVPGCIPAHAQEIVSWANEFNKSDAVLRVVPDVNNLDLLPVTGRVVLDVSGYLGKKTTKRDLRALLTHLAANKQLGGLLDFAATVDVSNLDGDLRNMLCLAGKPTVAPSSKLSDADFYAVEHSVALAKWLPSFVTRWTVRIHCPTAQSVLKKRGWGLVGKAGTLGELLKFSGGMVATDPALDELLKSQGSSLAELSAILQSAGKPMKPVLEGVPEEAVVFELLGK